MGESWRDRAACRGTAPTNGENHPFYPAKGRVGAEAQRPQQTFCASCPVQSECLDYALANPDVGRYGIWGGKTHDQRRRIARQRRLNLRVV